MKQSIQWNDCLREQCWQLNCPNCYNILALKNGSIPYRSLLSVTEISPRPQHQETPTNSNNALALDSVQLLPSLKFLIVGLILKPISPVVHVYHGLKVLQRCHKARSWHHMIKHHSCWAAQVDAQSQHEQYKQPAFQQHWLLVSPFAGEGRSRDGLDCRGGKDPRRGWDQRQHLPLHPEPCIRLLCPTWSCSSLRQQNNWQRVEDPHCGGWGFIQGNGMIARLLQESAEDILVLLLLWEASSSGLVCALTDVTEGTLSHPPVGGGTFFKLAVMLCKWGVKGRIISCLAASTKPSVMTLEQWMNVTPEFMDFAAKCNRS